MRGRVVAVAVKEEEECLMSGGFVSWRMNVVG